MKTIIFQGGLGNQIFQYAFYKYYIEKYKQKTYVLYISFDGPNKRNFDLCKYFDVSIVKAPWYIIILYKLAHLFDNMGLHFLFSREDEQLTNIFIEGYWQNKLYFNKNFITFKHIDLSNKNLDTLKKIEKTNSVSIHVRRGDYTLPTFEKIYGGICTKDYYNNAIELAYKKLEDCSFFIFSDDIEWVRENLDIPFNATYIDWNKGNDSFIDMYLMSFATINIIANSSFSYWSAYLNKKSNVVIYPKKWYKSHYIAPDIFPSTWIGI